KGTKMGKDEMFEGFEGFDHSQYADEARERWGDTEAYKESTRRTRSYTKAQWDELGREVGALEARMAVLLGAGADPEGPEAMEVAEGMRRHIDRWFYPCAPEMHVGLA